jgi:homocysteine S-methyltransferase
MAEPRKPFAEALATGALVADGAMGTELYARGVSFDACYEELNVSRPELVQRVHEDYIRAGAQVLETNTFGANAIRLEKHGLSARVHELNLAAVRIARAAARGRAYVVGAIGPSGDASLPEPCEGVLHATSACSLRDLGAVESALGAQARALVEGGVDAIVVETMRQTRELRAGVIAAVRATERSIPVIALASLDARGVMADGTTAAEIARLAKEWGASAAGVSCSEGPNGVVTAIASMRDAGLPLVAMPNAGLPRKIDERLVYASTPDEFGRFACQALEVGVKIVGGCCGTTPEHVARMAAAWSS